MTRELTNIFDLKVSPRVLVEASAGTGKTYTIVGIFVRLLLEKDLSVEQILTVTFTKKATAELRERVLERLRECLSVLESHEEPKGTEPFLSHLYSAYKEDEGAREKLRAAIRNFDDSQVFTIHGFCQKILQEEALAAGTPFEMAVNPSDPLYETAAEDFWRLFIHRHSDDRVGRFLISRLLKIAANPKELIGGRALKPLLEKQYATPEGDVTEDAKAFVDTLVDLKSTLVEVWNDERESILEILTTCDISRYTGYLKGRREKLESFLDEDEFQTVQPQSLGYFTDDYLYNESNLKKNGDPVQKHRFFEIAGTYKRLSDQIGQVDTTLLKQAFDDIKDRRSELSKSTESYSYNDLLISLRDALHDAGRGITLAEKLRKRYPVALVDEFQDTDPIQYDIFKAIYPSDVSSTSLMMIGDPKQAIYAFRGADIYTYFRARQDGVDDEYTLKKNYRSTDGYIKAINRLFDGKHTPFIESEIDFQPSDPGRADHDARISVSGIPKAPLQIVTRKGVRSNKDDARGFAFRQTVNRIRELLDTKTGEGAKIGERPVTAGDIAILVTRNKDAYTLQHRLKAYGIDSVTKTDQSIFETLEAQKVEMLMNAVLHPSDPGIMNAVLLTGIFGFSIEHLREMAEDDDARLELTEELIELSEIWRREGFISMFYRLIYLEHRLVFFSEISNSERVITNLFHLANLCSNAEKEHLLSPEKLHTWLLRQMNETDIEEKELQLESDQHLVKIMTTHSSKGLQFPIVFCPTLWMRNKPESFSSKPGNIVEYHNPESESLMLNFDQTTNEQRLRAEVRSDIESIAEEVRKAYVALTRAQYATIVIWDSHTYSHLSGLGASLIGRQLVEETIQNKNKLEENAEIDDIELINRFRNLEEQSDQTIQVEVVEEEASSQNGPVRLGKETAQFKFSNYSGRDFLPVQKSLESFTSLAGHNGDTAEPDYDQLLDNYSAPFDDHTEAYDTKATTIFDFPKGSTAGTAIHKLFEHPEFRFDGVEPAVTKAIAKEVLAEYGFDEKWAHVIQTMIGDVTSCEIPDVDLSSVSPENELREMEFNFPTASIEGPDLLSIIRDGRETVTDHQSAQRYLTGFIDLIVRQNGRYTIIDYKSNYLGDSLQDYQNDRLKEEILNASYDLQYHLYTVALVKYLRASIADFDYEKHFNGVAYLFVRGMRAGSSKAVWFHKPEKEVIDNLESILRR